MILANDLKIFLEKVANGLGGEAAFTMADVTTFQERATPQHIERLRELYEREESTKLSEIEELVCSVINE